MAEPAVQQGVQGAEEQVLLKQLLHQELLIQAVEVEVHDIMQM